MQLKKQGGVIRMFERLVPLLFRLKAIFLKWEERQKEATGNEKELEILKVEVNSLKKDHSDAMKALDELDEVIKKWES